MESNYKPEGYNSVSPYLIVNGADATIAFSIEVFNALVLRRIPNPEGKLIHAEVRIEDTVVMIADAGDGWSPMPAHVHIYVRDVDSTYQRAIAAGGISVQQPIKKEDEDKRGGVKDLGGTTWWIATKVE